MKTTPLLLSFLLACSMLCGQKADSSKTSPPDSLKKCDRILFNVGVGASLIRYTLSPSFHYGFCFSHAEKWQAGLNADSYFFFEQTLKADNSKDYHTYINTFVNAEFLLKGFFDVVDGENIWYGLGLGYLVGRSGDYFFGNTAKLYFVTKFKHVTITEDLIFTNDFKTFFPGLSLQF
ncbi:MAG: hypothetical protein PSX36_08650 [bacterium]|nr:hypothetical protein [bacterium]